MSNKYAVVSGRPEMKVRNFESRNRRKMRNRLTRLENRYGTLVKVLTDSGRLKVYTSEQMLHTGNNKRDAERYAKKVDGTFVQL